MITALNDDCSLQTLRINGEEILDFHPDTLAYQIIYPIGTDSAALITEESVQAVAADANANVMITSDGYNFTIIVTAHDGQHMRVYTIEQIILLSSNTRLQAIHVDGVLLREFDPEVLEYTYYVSDVQPEVIATAEDSTSNIDYSIYTADQPFYIYVTAEDGSEQIYTIYFEQSTISSSIKPSANDVLIKHMGGMDFAVATLRKNVSIGVYTSHGNMIFLSKIAETSQNDAIIGTNADGTDQLLDVHTTTTQFTLPEKDQIFFYVFFENDKQRIKSGKLMVTD
jgi:heat shock protein HspQ